MQSNQFYNPYMGMNNVGNFGFNNSMGNQNYFSNNQMDNSMGNQMGNNMQTNSTFCKIVDSEEAVRAFDIPMDGRMYYFAKADNSMIYGKKWMNDLTTKVFRYKMVPDEQKDGAAEENMWKEVSEKLSTIDERISKIEKNVAAPVKQNQKSSKKEEEIQ